MRFMYDYNQILAVEEFEEIDASPVWYDGMKGKENNPDSFCLTIYKAGWNIADIDKRECLVLTGEYNLDGTEETYKKAVENYNAVCMKLLETGFCKASDFENFTWD